MSILTVTLNAAIDKRYDLAELHVGEVQRVQRVSASAGGKGLNVARGAQLCGEAVLATGFVAGFAGQFVTSHLSAMGIEEHFLSVAGETRTCINIIEADGRSTEFLEPGVQVGPEDLAALAERYRELLPHVGAVTLSGSAPSGCPEDVYLPLIAAAKQAGLPVVLDTSGALLRAGLAAAPTAVKPNREELAAVTGAPVDDLPAVIAAARVLLGLGPQWVVTSLGADGALAVGSDRAVHVRPPRIELANPVGCGDVLVAGLACGLAGGLDVADALPGAVAASAAAAAHPETGTFDPALAQKLLDQLQLTTY